MASTLDHEITEAIVVNQALVEENLRVISESCKQLANKGMNDAFGLEDAAKKAIETHYETQGYQVVPIAYTSVYGPSGKAIYSFDLAYEACKPGDDEKLLLIGEVKFSLSRSDVEAFVSKAGRLTTRFTRVREGTMPPSGAINYANQIDFAKRLLEHTVVMLVAGWRILPDAMFKARDAGCHLVASTGSHFAVYHYSDIDERMRNQLTVPSLLSQDEDEV